MARRRFEIVVRVNGDDVKSVARHLKEASELVGKMKDLPETFTMKLGDVEGSFDLEGSRDDAWSRERYISETRRRD